MMEWLAYKIAIFLSSVLSRKLSYRIAAFIGKLRFYLFPSDRKAVLCNLGVVMAGSPKKEIRRKITK
jgi:lauroyl/myristoyl acyltransferase